MGVEGAGFFTEHVEIGSTLPKEVTNPGKAGSQVEGLEKFDDFRGVHNGPWESGQRVGWIQGGRERGDALSIAILAGFKKQIMETAEVATGGRPHCSSINEQLREGRVRESVTKVVELVAPIDSDTVSGGQRE